MIEMNVNNVYFFYQNNMSPPLSSPVSRSQKKYAALLHQTCRHLCLYISVDGYTDETVHCTLHKKNQILSTVFVGDHNILLNKFEHEVKE